MKSTPPPIKGRRPALTADHASSLRRGFTLFELLIVVVLITLLIAILLPALARGKAVGRQVACLGMLRQFTLANTGYTVDFNGYCAPMYDSTQTTLGASFPGVAWSANRVFRDLMNTDQSDPTALTPSAAAEAAEHWRPSYICPDAERALSVRDAAGRCIMRLSYGQNYSGFGGTNGLVRGSFTYLGSPPRPCAAYRLQEIGRPSESMFMADGLDFLLDSAFQGYKDEYFDSFGIAFRHLSGASNVNFFDGHAA